MQNSVHSNRRTPNKPTVVLTTTKRLKLPKYFRKKIIHLFLNHTLNSFRVIKKKIKRYRQPYASSIILWAWLWLIKGEIAFKWIQLTFRSWKERNSSRGKKTQLSSPAKIVVSSISSFNPRLGIHWYSYFFSYQIWTFMASFRNWESTKVPF